VPYADGSFDEEDLIKKEDVLVSITQRGYIKRVPWTVYRAQDRGGRGVLGMATGDEDEIALLTSANSHDTLLFFTDRGKVYQERVYQIPDVGRTAKGVMLAGILAIGSDEHVTAVMNVPDFDEARYLNMITHHGVVKRVSLSEFEAVRPSGLIAIRLRDGDELRWVRLTQGSDELILVTEQGRGIRFSEADVRPVGRTAMGVIGVRLQEDDRVAVAEVIEPGAQLFLATRSGYGRCTPLTEFSPQHRGGKGVIAYRTNQHTGLIADGRVVLDDDEVTLMSEGGIILRTQVARIPVMGRYTRGVRMMDLKAGDRVASIARLFDDDDGTADREPDNANTDQSDGDVIDDVDNGNTATL
jgi:DNA gyrase subunit A